MSRNHRRGRSTACLQVGGGQYATDRVGAGSSVPCQRVQAGSRTLRLEYRDNPLGYIADVLGVTLTPDQERVVRSLMEHRRVLCPSGHSVGKTDLAGCLVLWWYDTRSPGICLTTAPTERQARSVSEATITEWL